MWKTEAVAVLVGPGATEARNQLVDGCQELSDSDLLVLALSDGGGIRIVSAYKHLGIKVSAVGGHHAGNHGTFLFR